ncbi:MAG: T9SS type A sorting domain-containing protein [Ignavibacteriae bacterium]|nr:T9SS type A sorting domain-containing protein [Ignavibacteriota bacterium]
MKFQLPSVFHVSHFSRAVILATLLPLAFTVQTRAQTSRIRVTNDVYTHHVTRVGAADVFVVDGIAPDADGPVRRPVRRIRFAEAPEGAVVALRAVEYGASYKAWPYYGARYVLQADSSLAAVHIRREAPSSDTGVSILSQRLTYEDGVLRPEVEVPLLDFDAARGETRWVRTYEFEYVFAAGPAGSLPAPTARGPYRAQPFIRRSADLDTSGAWIDRGAEALRFDIRTDGIVRIDAAWLRAAGVDPASINPAGVRLVKRGTEIPLHAVGLDDGSFGDQDAFFFYGKRRYDDGGYRFVPADPDDPCPQYINKYGDSSAYWLFLGTASGRRAQVIAAPAVPPRDTVNWAFELVHHEADNYLFAVSTDPVRQQVNAWTADKTWFETWLGIGKASFAFQADNVRSGPRARIWQKSGSWTAPTSFTPNHRVTVALNGGPVLDSVVYNVNRQGLVVARGSGTDIKNGENLLDVRNVKFYEGDNALYLDWFDVEYPRHLVARGPRLDFGVDPDMGSGPALFRITGLSAANPLILRRKGNDVVSLAPVSISATAPFTLVFADTLVAGTQYSVHALDSVPAAPPAQKRVIADLRSTASQAVYLVITARDFLAEAQEYSRFITQSYNVSTRVVAVEDVYDNYSFGQFQPEAIKVFLFDAMNTWTQQTPRYLLLAGDANYNYKNASTPQSFNFVPTYGFPVSDIWFGSFDTLSIEPSLAIGRITAHSGAELLAYRDKHARMLAAPPDVWDKTSLHFSGGTTNIPQEKIDELRRINESVIREAVLPAPYAGNPVHFYKTKTPPTDFGPFTASYVQEKIGEGGIIISYIGHAAIRTWDNTIGDPAQLFNNSGRASLVSDFGCSTSKFADPDGSAFAELFVVPEGTQAIGYIGNAAIGYTSTAAIMPVLFYRSLLREGAPSIGDAHLASKRELLRLYGNSVVNRIAIQSNTLIGDPIARLPVPRAPNLVARAEWVRPGTDIFTNAMDTLAFRIVLANFGTLTPDSVTIVVRDMVAGSARVERRFRRPLPSLYDTLDVSIPGGDVPGAHVLRVMADADSRVDESREDDNTADYPFTVLSTHLQIANVSLVQTADGRPEAVMLNPILNPGDVREVLVEFDTTVSFVSPLLQRLPYQRTTTRIDMPASLPPGARVYWRARLDAPAAEYVGPYSFWNTTARLPFVQRDSAAFATVQRENALLTREGITLAPGARALRVIGSGYNDGNYGTVSLDGRNLLPTTFGRGYYIVILDSVTITPDTIAIYDTYENPGECQRAAAFLQSVPFGKIIAIATMDDPFSYHPSLPAALKGIGSLHADTLLNYDYSYRGNYAIIGRRGAASGTVQEGFNSKFQGRVLLDTSYVVDSDTALVVSPFFGPARRWTTAYLERTPTAATGIAVMVEGQRRDGTIETVLARANPDTLDLSAIDAARYPRLRLAASLIPRPGSTPPVLKGWSAGYVFLPELALNYQSVSISPDSVAQGDPAHLAVSVTNAGESDAAGFVVHVETTGPDNIRRPIAAMPVVSLRSGAWFDTTLTLATAGFSGPQNVAVYVDRDGAVSEQYETNNSFITRLKVQRDTVPPMLTVLFDGQDPPEGDYIRPTPAVLLRLADASPLRVTSPAAFTITLDDSAVSTAGLPFTPMSATGPAELQYTPQLATGEHVFRFNARDESGNPATPDDVVVRVLVDTDGKVLSLVNYPNPFADNTAFVFTLTGEAPPEAIEVKLYTVAGRLIRTIIADPGALRLGQNVLPWDGRDEDGDVIANGVYFYKFITRSNAATREILGRLAKLR